MDRERSRIDKEQLAIDRAERLKRLMSNDDFKFFLDILRQKQKECDSVLHSPKRIGSLDVKNLPDRTELVRYSEEDDRARIKEAQIRWHTFEQAITLADSFVKYAEFIKKKREKEQAEQPDK